MRQSAFWAHGCHISFEEWAKWFQLDFLLLQILIPYFKFVGHKLLAILLQSNFALTSVWSTYNRVVYIYYLSTCSVETWLTRTTEHVGNQSKIALLISIRKDLKPCLLLPAISSYQIFWVPLLLWPHVMCFFNYNI